MSHTEWLGADPSEHAGLARSRLNHWLDCWDFGDRAELISRLKSGDEDQFRGAFWELSLNALFGALGFSVTRDPLGEGGNERTPDFLVSSAKTTFFVEATSVGRSREVSSFESLRDELAALLDRHERHDFAISLWIEDFNTTAPSGRRLGTAIRQWLDGLDVTRVADSNERGDFVKMVFSDSGWTFEVTAIPLPPGSDPIPLVGVLGANQGGLITDKRDLRRALEAKRPSHYGKLDHPYVIAVLERAFPSGREQWHRVGALFGDEAITLHLDGTSTSSRQANGYWLGRSGWRQLDVAGVILSIGMVLGEEQLALPEYWPHPEPTKPTGPDGLPLAGMELVGTKLQARACLRTWDGFAV